MRWTFLDQVPGPIHAYRYSITLLISVLLLLLVLVGATANKKAQGSDVSNPIGMQKFGRIAHRVNTNRLMKLDFDMTSYFQDGGRDVISRKASSPLHVTSLARCNRIIRFQLQFTLWCEFCEKLADRAQVLLIVITYCLLIKFLTVPSLLT